MSKMKYERLVCVICGQKRRADSEGNMPNHLHNGRLCTGRGEKVHPTTHKLWKRRDR